MELEFKRLHRLMTDAKCSLLLDTARKRIKHVISNDEYHILEPSKIDHIIKNQMIQKLSSSVVDEVYNKIEKEDLLINKSYELDVVVIPTSDLKLVVNYLVQNMSLEDILKIRGYGKDDKNFSL